MLGVCKYFLLETNISLKQVYKTFYPVNSLIRDARWNRSDGLKSSSSYIKQPSVVAKRVIDTQSKWDIDTHAKFAVIYSKSRGRYFISRQHKNNRGKVFKQTLLTHLHVNSHLT